MLDARPILGPYLMQTREGIRLMGLFTQSGQLQYQPRPHISPEQAEHELDRFEKITELLFTQRPVSLKLDQVVVTWDDFIVGYYVRTWWLNRSFMTEGAVMELLLLQSLDYLRWFTSEQLRQVRGQFEILAHELWDYERKLAGRRELETTAIQAEVQAIVKELTEGE